MCRTCSRRQTELTTLTGQCRLLSRRLGKVYERDGTVKRSALLSLENLQGKKIQAQKNLDHARAICPDKS